MDTQELPKDKPKPTTRPTRGSMASTFFHNESNNWNCAQSVHKSQQELTGLSDEQIELTYRSKGGGRAEGGMCGAIYAASGLVGGEHSARLIEEFRQRAGGLTCAELKGKYNRPCSVLVDMAQEILLETQATQNEKTDEDN
ncbi:MAG: C-GCAxxG-C-C family protein [Porphyromonadaceae bacterium]|nr:C-GCAxxG-C-C family protein [Porphyromonadaceae bacterium]